VVLQAFLLELTERYQGMPEFCEQWSKVDVEHAMRWVGGWVAGQWVAGQWVAMVASASCVCKSSACACCQWPPAGRWLVPPQPLTRPGQLARLA